MFFYQATELHKLQGHGAGQLQPLHHLPHHLSRDLARDTTFMLYCLQSPSISPFDGGRHPSIFHAILPSFQPHLSSFLYLYLYLFYVIKSYNFYYVIAIVTYKDKSTHIKTIKYIIIIIIKYNLIIFLFFLGW